VLAVGDESFQKKCIAWMERFLAEDGTLLLCSHSMYHIQKLCRHALWLRDGRTVRFGPANEVTQAYLAYHEEKSAHEKQPMPAQAAEAAGVYAIQSLDLVPEGSIAQDRDLTIRGTVYSPDGRPPAVLIGIVRADGTPVYGVATDMDGIVLRPLPDKLFGFSLTLLRLPLLPGKYFVRAHALDPEAARLFDHVERSLFVTGETRELGFVHLPHRWNGE